MSKRDNIIKWSIISVFVGLYAMVSIISTIHVIDFFELSNPSWLAITLAIAFEVGAAASLAAIVILDKTSRFLVWMLFLLITGMQMMGNMYYAFVHLEDFQSWIELFGLVEEDPITQKRWLSAISGAILPIVALGFIKSLVDYIRPTKEEDEPKQPGGKLPTFEPNPPTQPDPEPEPETEDDMPDKVEGPEEEFDEDHAHDQAVNAMLDDLTEEDVKTIMEGIENPSEPNAKLKDAASRYMDIERKIAKAIAANPELKEKLEEEIKKINTEDKYTKEPEKIQTIDSEKNGEPGHMTPGEAGFIPRPPM